MTLKQLLWSIPAEDYEKEVYAVFSDYYATIPVWETNIAPVIKAKVENDKILLYVEEDDEKE